NPSDRRERFLATPSLSLRLSSPSPANELLAARHSSKHLMSNLLQDIKFGLRLLLKNRSFTLTALLTLAVCIGANAAMFSVVRSVLLKPLPFPESERVVLLYNSYPK